MVVKFVSTENSGLGTRVSLAAGDDAVIGRNGLVVSSTYIGIDGAGGNSVMVQGMVGGSAAGIILGLSDTSALINRVTVDAGGALWSTQSAIALYGQDARLTNHGTITGDSAGVSLNAKGDGLAYLFNDGSIDGGTFGLLHNGTEALSITNKGTIRGLSAAISQADAVGADGRLSIYNTGDIIGEIVGADGADQYVSRGAGELLGLFRGGGGDDRFVSGDAGETFYGGTGSDTAVYTRRSAIIVTEDGVSEGLGGAEGDILSSVEIIYGSRLGADQIYGGASNNGLYGDGGNDTLSGGLGIDTLTGGTGRDTLAGGGGNDRFVFISPAEAPDVISDFSSATLGNDDQFAIRGTAFGGLALGTLARGLFISRADNLAQDLNDRFIFRTSDTTLWFDSNGKQAGGLTLLADLQAGAVMGYQDIVVI